MFLARKISREKWDAIRNSSLGLTAGEISADAVTGDLRTRDNALSVWHCRTDRNGDIEDAALAIAAAGDRLDKIDIVWLADEELRADGHILKVTRGITPIKDLADRHVDICCLDYHRLGRLATSVASAIEARRCRRLTRTRIMKLLDDPIRVRRISTEELSDGIQRALK